ncbi:hypothetical protein ZIOFF_037094 [Zingiber officinale]|uniref:Uncharacterized protein n=1 Tax=Zingiber officinale TaxID=94328 RepID=A0A8J5L3V7_ZINOF|nr:hypothetical protein ZIOFF_037094 [Zingiber officinale]
MALVAGDGCDSGCSERCQRRQPLEPGDAPRGPSAEKTGEERGGGDFNSASCVAVIKDNVNPSGPRSGLNIVRLCEHKCEFLAIYAIVASSSLPPFAKTAQKLINARSDMLLDSVSPVLFQAALHVREKKLAKAKEVFISMQTYSRTNPNWKLQISSSIMGEKTRPFSNMRNLSRAMGMLRLYVCTDLRWSTKQKWNLGYPRGFDPAKQGPSPDPGEMATKERSGYRPRGKIKESHISSQGAVVREKRDAATSSSYHFLCRRWPPTSRPSQGSSTASKNGSSQKATTERPKAFSNQSRHLVLDFIMAVLLTPGPCPQVTATDADPPLPRPSDFESPAVPVQLEALSLRSPPTSHRELPFSSPQFTSQFRAW